MSWDYLAFSMVSRRPRVANEKTAIQPKVIRMPCRTVFEGRGLRVPASERRTKGNHFVMSSQPASGGSRNRKARLANAAAEGFFKKLLAMRTRLATKEK